MTEEKFLDALNVPAPRSESEQTLDEECWAATAVRMADDANAVLSVVMSSLVGLIESPFVAGQAPPTAHDIERLRETLNGIECTLLMAADKVRSASRGAKAAHQGLRALHGAGVRHE